MFYSDGTPLIWHIMHDDASNSTHAYITAYPYEALV